jgi:aminoglycoside phosphotransferase family enzyme/predicted kinase
VFLTEQHAFKVKRAKDFGFFDFTTLAARERFCREELRLNRRTAPDVYLDVLPVRRDARGHSLTRPGTLVDWAVQMRRLPDERSAAALLEAGRLGDEDLATLARAVAGFHRSLAPLPPALDALVASCDENFAQLAPFAGGLFAPDALARIERLQRDWLAAQHALLAARPSCDGHGDLRLEHAYLLPEGPLFLDCIEFLARFRIADPALDAAFLAMDLYRAGRPAAAERFLGCYAYERGDYDLYPLADGYLSYRALVRAKVAAFVATDPASDPATAARKRNEAVALLQLALRCFAPRGTAWLIGVGGVIGTGKSTVAQRVAGWLGAAIVSADATRKELAGLAHDARAAPAQYSAEATARVQQELLRRAGLVLASGRPVLLDTTFSAPQLRVNARALAARHRARWLFVECRAPEPVLRERLRARRGGVSDAREDLLEASLAGFAPVDLPPDEHLGLDTTLPQPAQDAALRARLNR